MADLNSRGELQLKATYSYAALEQVPGAAELIGLLAGFLWREPAGFEEVLPAPTPGFTFRWRGVSTVAGIASLRYRGQLASVTLLASGLEAADDRLTLEAFQAHLLRELHDTGYEPAFDLLDLADRPLAATINFSPPADPAARPIAALADRCFAAAYFRFQGLA